MLKELRIKNFVLIDALTLTFEQGICLLTGETGAGKSILIDAVAAAVGGRVSLDLIRTGAAKAVIEATFLLDHTLPPDLAALLEEEGLVPDVPGELTLSRELSPRGARCRIEGQQVTQAVLRRAGRSLVDIMSQHEHQALLDPQFHLELLDQFGRLAGSREAVATHYRAWSALQLECQTLVEGARARAQQEDFWRYQLQEIEDAGLTNPHEDSELKAERLRLANVEQLRGTSASAYDRLYAGESSPSLYDQLARITQSLASQAHLDQALSEASGELETAQLAVREAASRLRQHLEGLDADPARLEAVEERLDTLNMLVRKYGPGLEQVIGHAGVLAKQLAEVESADSRLEGLKAAITQAEASLRAAADRLSAERKLAAVALEAAVEAQLRELELPSARFSAALSPLRAGASWRLTGQEGCEFEIAMNPGELPRSLARTASGGEMARVMLAIKTVLAGLNDIPTLIFDEVDTGISGKAAQAVAEKLAGLGCHYQILCITHLPTVAAMADQHIHLEKHVVDGRTQVAASQLDALARVRELALLSSGSPAPKAMQHAEELLGRASEYKTALVPQAAPAVPGAR